MTIPTLSLLLNGQILFMHILQDFNPNNAHLIGNSNQSWPLIQTWWLRDSNPMARIYQEHLG